MSEAFQEPNEYCNKNQFEVKGIVPITEAEAYTYGQADHHTFSDYKTGVGGGYGWGLGYGYGVSMIVGFGAVLERTEEFSDEEYKRRIDELELKDREEGLEKTVKVNSERVKAISQEVSEIAAYMDEDVKTFKPLIGGPTHSFGGQKYDSCNDAEAAKADAQRKHKNLMEEKEQRQRRIDEAMAEISNL